MPDTSTNLQPLIEAIASQTAIITQFIQKFDQPASSSNSTSRNYQFDEFNDKKETFSQYKERLENFFTLQNIDVSKDSTLELRGRILVNSIGTHYYQLLAGLIAPDSPIGKKYDELIKLLEDHLCPPPNVQTERHKFLSRVQKPDESIAAYVAALKALTLKCEFKCSSCEASVTPLFLCSQFVRGVQSAHIRERLLEEPELTDKRAVELALSAEASRQGSQFLSGPVKPVEQQVNAVKPNPKNTKNSSKSSFSKDDKKSGSNTSKYQADKAKKKPDSFRNKRTLIRDLGLSDLCLFCGYNNHKTDDCKSRDRLHCSGCGKSGHVVKVCITTLLKKTKQVKNIKLSASDDEYSYSLQSTLNQINTLNAVAQKFYANIKIGDTFHQFEVDSGSPITIMSETNFKKLNLSLPIIYNTKPLNTYTHESFSSYGYVTVPIEFNNEKSTGTLYLVHENYDSLAGGEWIRKLRINLLELVDPPSSSNSAENCVKNISSQFIIENFPDVSTETIGKIPDYQISLELPAEKELKPVFLKSRPIPLALLSKVNQELDYLIKCGVLEKVDYSPWGTPLVVVPKPSGKIRLCGDYKTTLNPQLSSNRYPIPRILDIMHKIKYGYYFCILDIHHAYLHICLDEASSIIATLSTHRGALRVKRLYYGIKTAPNEFHKIMDQALADLEGVMAYFDDILIQGSTKEECERRLIACLHRLRKINVHLNLQKCKFFVRKIQYLGHVISERGFEKSPEKVKAILQAPRPTDLGRLRSLLGMIQYYNRFIPEAAKMLHPLNRLLQSNVKFEWSSACEKAFQQVKKELASDQVLVPFQQEYPVILSTDASPYGLGAILSHNIEGAERPVAFASRSLTKNETSYSQLDKEATAVYWAVKYFYQFLYGRQFTLKIDNAPLERIFHPEKSLPVMSAHRLLRYAQFLSGFDYTIQRKSSIQHANVDYLSRNPIPLPADLINFQEDSYHVNQLTFSLIATTAPITPAVIRKATNEDPELSNFKNQLLNGDVKDTEYSLHDGCVMRGSRVIIPEKLQPAVLTELHSSHVGIVRMKGIARSLCYWKNIDSDIEHTVKACQACAEVNKNVKKAPPHVWLEPEKCWQRIHADYAGPYHNKHFLVTIDAKSKWLEVKIFNAAPTSASTINAFIEIFARNGLPEMLVTDNASYFKSEVFLQFCAHHAIVPRNSAPGHPATNGIAERSVQTLKQRLEKMSADPNTLSTKLHAFLLSYRSTALACGRTPAELFYGRQIRTRLDLMRPIVTPPGKPDKENSSEPVKYYLPGERVQSRNYQGSALWKFGTIIERIGRLQYLVELDHGYILKRHFNQLRPTEVEPPVSSLPVVTPTLLRRDQTPAPPACLVAAPNRPSQEEPITPPSRPITRSTPAEPTDNTPPVATSSCPKNGRQKVTILPRSDRPVRTRRPVERLNL